MDRAYIVACSCLTFWFKLDNLFPKNEISYTQSLAHAFFLGLVKIRMNQIRSTLVINNQKRMSEGIPSLT